MRTFAHALCLLAALSVPAAAFEIPGVGKVGAPAAAGAPSAGVSDLLKQVQSLSGSYQGATKSMLTGREKVLSAFSLKDEAAKVRAEAGRIASGQVTAEEVGSASATMGSADEAIKKAIEGKKTLAKDGKKQFAAGMTEMAAGLKAEAALAGPVKDAGASATGALKGAGLADVPKVQLASELLGAMGSKLPIDLAATKGTLGLCVEAAKAFNVKVPAGVAEALAAAP